MGLHLYPLQQGLVRVKVSGWSSVSQSNVALVPLKNLSHLTLLCQMVTALITVSRPLPFQCLSSDVHTQPAPPAPPQHLHPGLFIIPLKTQASSDNRQRTTWTACDLLDVDCGIEKNADPPLPSSSEIRNWWGACCCWWLLLTVQTGSNSSLSTLSLYLRWEWRHLERCDSFMVRRDCRSELKRRFRGVSCRVIIYVWISCLWKWTLSLRHQRTFCEK